MPISAQSDALSISRPSAAWITAAEDAIVRDGPSNRVFTLDGDAHSSTVIRPANSLSLLIEANIAETKSSRISSQACGRPRAASCSG